MALAVDTSAILASLDEAYAEHEAIAAILASETGSLAVSPMVIAEADYIYDPAADSRPAALPAAPAAVGS